VFEAEKAVRHKKYTFAAEKSCSLFDTHSLRVNIDSGNSISGSNNSRGNQNLHVSKISPGKSHEISDVQNVWFQVYKS